MDPIRYPLTLASATFGLFHLAALGVFLVPFSWKLAVLAAGLYVLRMFGVTAGYHRYFSHRAYRLGRVPQFLLAVLAQSSGQKGALWWAGHHRDHHRHSDKAEDIHSPVQRGFFWSHMGWILSDRFDRFDASKVKDLEKFQELVWMDRHHWIPALLLALAVGLWGFLTGVGLLSALAWHALSTVLLYHGTFTINSLAHVWGTRRFATTDQSRNNPLLALITLGEGWHNNHHRYPGACRQGLRWWEIDLTQGGIRLLGWLGIARDIRAHPAEAKR